MNKYIGLAIVSISIALSSFSFAADAVDDVVSALRSGNATQLSKFFDTRVDVSLPSKSDNFSKNQAEMILRDFFTTNPVNNFVVKHKGENNGSQFCIGVLQTKSGNFRTKLYIRQKGDQAVLQEISFQTEE